MTIFTLNTLNKNTKKPYPYGIGPYNLQYKVHLNNHLYITINNKRMCYHLPTHANHALPKHLASLFRHIQ